jgi:predicted enzyme related to lactoylglutathione lyase
MHLTGPRDGRKKEDVPRLTRVLIRVNNIEAATAFYEHLLEAKGQRVSAGRCHYQLGAAALALYDPRAEGDLHDMQVNPGHAQIYIEVDDLEHTFIRAESAGAPVVSPIETRPWGERSFMIYDPSGNRLCFVAAQPAARR